jgi:hypothetical protein
MIQGDMELHRQQQEDHHSQWPHARQSADDQVAA